MGSWIVRFTHGSAFFVEYFGAGKDVCYSLDDGGISDISIGEVVDIDIGLILYWCRSGWGCAPCHR